MGVCAEISIKIQGNIYDTTLKQNVGTYTQSGNLKSMFKVQKQFVKDVLREIGVNINGLSAETLNALNEIPTNSFEAFKAFSIGLDYLDQGDFAQASQAFSNATKIDPNFGLAKSLERATPRSNQSVAQLLGKVLGEAKKEASKVPNEGKPENQGFVGDAQGQPENRAGSEDNGQLDAEVDVETHGENQTEVGGGSEGETQPERGADVDTEAPTEGRDQPNADIEGSVNENGEPRQGGQTTDVELDEIEDLDIPEQPKSSVQSICP